MFAEIGPDNWNPWTWSDMRRIAEARAKGEKRKTESVITIPESL